MYPLTGNDIGTYTNAVHEIKRLEMFALDRNNENELLKSHFSVKNVIENGESRNKTKNIGRISEEYVIMYNKK